MTVGFVSSECQQGSLSECTHPGMPLCCRSLPPDLHGGIGSLHPNLLSALPSPKTASCVALNAGCLQRILKQHKVCYRHGSTERLQRAVSTQLCGQHLLQHGHHKCYRRILHGGQWHLTQQVCASSGMSCAAHPWRCFRWSQHEAARLEAASQFMLLHHLHSG